MSRSQYLTYLTDPRSGRGSIAPLRGLPSWPKIRRRMSRVVKKHLGFFFVDAVVSTPPSRMQWLKNQWWRPPSPWPCGIGHNVQWDAPTYHYASPLAIWAWVWLLAGPGVVLSNDIPDEPLWKVNCL